MMKTGHRLLLFACWVSLAYCYTFGKLDYTFRCHNGTGYILNEFYCDGIKNCDDGEDEQLGCKYEGTQGNNTCGKSQFSCDNGQCKNITVRCNTIKDCNDGTDELNCGDEINVKNCTSEDKFLCHDGLRCLDLDYTCDDRCNCFDCSDENENCLKNDYDLMKRCGHSYFATAHGPKCFCDSNNTSSKTQTLCNSIEDCQYFESSKGSMKFCEQRCIKYKSRSQCACREGNPMVNGSNGFECLTNDHFTVLYINPLEIRSVNDTYKNPSTILNGISNGTLLAAANDYVYYATLSHDGKGSIFKASLHFGKPEKLIETDYAITSIAVDYITNNIYFTSNGSLSVCKNDATICTQLKCCNVTYSTLVPKYGWIFYTQMNTHNNQFFCNNGSFLTRSNMDGSNETIRESHCYGNEITIKMDESINTLYLLEEIRENERNGFKSKLHVIPLIRSPFEEQDAWKNVDIQIHFGPNVQHFSFYKKEMFFTCDKYRGLHRAKNVSPGASSTMESIVFKVDDFRSSINYSITSNIKDVYVYNAALQHSNENPCEKLPSCSGLCLLKPQIHSSQFFLNRTCICEGFTPTEGSHWCSNHIILYGANYGSVCVGVLGMLVFAILGITGYYIRMKGNWLRYYLELRHWRPRRWGIGLDEVLVFDNQRK